MHIEYCGHNISAFDKFVLGGDLGGTNSKLGIAGVKDERTTPLYFAHFRTQELDSIVPAIEEVLDYSKQKHSIETDSSCFGVAGIINQERNFSDLTNAKWTIDTREIVNKTILNSASLLNDFEAIGYGLNVLDEKDFFNVTNKSGIPKMTKAIMGAGTGVGKGILIYQNEFYVPLPSEGGHMDFPVQTREELDYIEFVKAVRNVDQVSFEDTVSGKGIENIYLYLRHKNGPSEHSDEIDSSKDKVPLIAKYKYKDLNCKETFRWYSKFYGRCARNFVLDYLPRGGLYIAGGIAPRHLEIFRSNEFTREFYNSHAHERILREIPINIVLNVHAGLFGACFVASI